MSSIEVLPVDGLPAVAQGDVLADHIVAAAELRTGDVIVVARALVSTVEGRVAEVTPALLEQEAARVLRRGDGLLITETAHGFVCADAGVDGSGTLLPVDPDRSARRIRDGLQARLDAAVAVIVSDPFWRPWRAGTTAVAIGCAGIAAVVDGRCVADELASAAALASTPVAVVRGVDPSWLRDGSVIAEVVRAGGDDLFR